MKEITKKIGEPDNRVADGWGFLLRNLEFATLLRNYGQKFISLAAEINGEIIVIGDIRKEEDKLFDEFINLIEINRSERGTQYAESQAYKDIEALKRWLMIAPNAAILFRTAGPIFNKDLAHKVSEVLQAAAKETLSPSGIYIV